jgi:hypothetical protein
VARTSISFPGEGLAAWEYRRRSTRLLRRINAFCNLLSTQKIYLQGRRGVGQLQLDVK